MDEEIWKAHCRHMAAATRALADWCDDPEMLRGYLDLAAKWLAAESNPPVDPSEPEASGSADPSPPASGSAEKPFAAER